VNSKTLQKARSAADLSIQLALPEELEGLPVWFSIPLGQYLRSKQRNWPAKTVQRSTRQLFLRMKHMGEYFMNEYDWADWEILSARWLDDYIDYKLEQGLVPNSINWDLIHFCQLCNFLVEGGASISSAVLRLKKLDVPKRLPRPLPGNDVFVLEKCIQEALTGDQRWERNLKAVRDLAWFYLLWHCGLRVSEVCALTLQDVDFENGKFFVRNSKERKDRVIYMSEISLNALIAHLDTYPPQTTNYVFEVNGREMGTRMLQRRLNVYGQRCGVKVSPHRLRHTFASQMLNAGMPVTSLQRYLGHENLDTTMGYASISDPILKKEYNQAIRKMDPLWQLDEYAAKMQVAQQRIHVLTASLQQARQNAESYLVTLEEIQNLIEELRQDMA
jgi:site-specific recombinase XerD